MSYPTITGLPPAPQRSDTPAQFDVKANNWVAAIDEFAIEVNSAGDYIETTAAQVGTDKAEIMIAQDNALNASASAVAGANYKGEWSTLTGAYSVPSSVSHDGVVWLLKENIANITIEEPGTSAKWLPVSNYGRLDAPNLFASRNTFQFNEAQIVLKGTTEGATAYSYMQFKDSADDLFGYIGKTSSISLDITLSNNKNAALIFRTNEIERLKIEGNGAITAPNATFAGGTSLLNATAMDIRYARLDGGNIFNGAIVSNAAVSILRQTDDDALRLYGGTTSDSSYIFLYGKDSEDKGLSIESKGGDATFNSTADIVLSVPTDKSINLNGATQLQSINKPSVTTNKLYNTLERLYFGEVELTRGLLVVDSIEELTSVDPELHDKVLVRSYRVDSGFIGGGGVFIWRDLSLKNEHNGGTVIDPDRIYPTDWDNETQKTTWFTAAGSGQGTWRRQVEYPLPLTVFGATTTSDTIPTQKWIDVIRPDMSFVNTGITIGSRLLTSPAAIRDPFQVSRQLQGLTDCHAFADKTRITNITDAGTYGTFDATTEMISATNVNHLYGYQNRTLFDGVSGATIGTMGNFTQPTIKNGTCTTCYGLEIRNPNISSGGAITNNYGIYINNLVEGTSNVSILALQSTGWGFRMPSGADSFVAGYSALGQENCAIKVNRTIVTLSSTAGVTTNKALADLSIDAGKILKIESHVINTDLDRVSPGDTITLNSLYVVTWDATNIKITTGTGTPSKVAGRPCVLTIIHQKNVL